MSSGARKTEADGNLRREYYTAAYAVAERVLPQVEFALKFEGVPLPLLKQALSTVRPQELVDYIQERPTSENRRRIWFYYEWFTGDRLPLEDIKTGNYFRLLKSAEYFVGPERRERRQRVWNNLPGSPTFCPLVRRTDVLTAYIEKDLKKKCSDLVAGYSEDQLGRAMRYLFDKETRSSFEIEQQTPDASKAARFVALLQRAHEDCRFDLEYLVNLQHATVAPPYQSEGMRDHQVYIGRTIGFNKQEVHCAFPKSPDLAELMEGWREMSEFLTTNDGAHPVIAATLIAFGFIFLHPFPDGNGRIHRLLIHQVLAHQGYTPDGLIFPVSAAIVNNGIRYDHALESFSTPLMSLVEYELDKETHEMTVLNETVDFYRYIDMTQMAEALFFFIEQTIEEEFVQELEFLRNYDMAKPLLQEVLDMPNNRLDLFIQCCWQNQGRLSKKKRELFKELHDAEVAAMEGIIQDVFFTDEA